MSLENASATVTVTITPFDLQTVADASRRVALGDYRGLEEAEFAAAAIVNGRLDLIPGDFRKAIIRMGPGSAHAAIEQIFRNWELEMDRRTSDAEHPVGDQRIFS